MHLARIVAGERTGKVLVALHGVTDSAASLADVTQRLPGYQAVLLDAFSHGFSARLAPEDLEADPFAALVRGAVAAVIEEARWSDSGQVVLMGHSMGGAIATEVAARVPELVEALILEDPALPSERISVEQFREHIPSELDRVAEHRADAAAAVARHGDWPLVDLGGWLQAKTMVDRDFLARGVVTGQREAREQLRDVAERGGVPVLVVTPSGKQAVIGPKVGAELAALDGVRVAVLDGVGHCVRRDAPEQFFAEVRAFLGGIEHRERVPYLVPDRPDLVAERAPEQAFAFTADGHEVPLRIFPGAAEGAGVLVSAHGGGFVGGAAAMDDGRNAAVAAATGRTVIAVDYRLAPQHPHPAGVLDCLAAIEFAARHLAAHDRAGGIALLGDSAGCALQLGAAVRFLEAGPQGRSGKCELDAVVLLQPCVDPFGLHASLATHAEGPSWSRRSNEFVWRQLAGSDPEARRSDLVPTTARLANAGMPRTLVVANSADPLRDEGIALATELADLGLPAELRMFAGTHHAGQIAVWDQIEPVIARFIP